MSIYRSSTYIEDLRNTVKASVMIEKMKHSSVLVTGASGTIGSFCVDVLRRFNIDAGAGINIYAAGRNQERLERRFYDGENQNSEIHFLKYDLVKPIMFTESFDYVIHAAGNAYPDAFNSDPVGTIEGNVHGTYSLLEYAKEHGCKRFLYVSTGEVYGQCGADQESFRETDSGAIDILSPRSCYPGSKRLAETLCVSYMKQKGLETLIVRPCHTYAPGMLDGDNRANAQFIRNGVVGRNIILKSEGRQMRSYAYAADCISAMLTVLVKGTGGEAYNCANPEARCTIAKFAEIVAQASGSKVVYENPSPEDLANRSPVMRQILNTEKLEGLGWKGRYSVEKGVAHTLKILKGL